MLPSLGVILQSCRCHCKQTPRSLQTIEAVRALIAWGLIHAIWIQLWTSWIIMGPPGYLQKLPTEMYKAIRNYCFIDNPYQVRLKIDLSERPRTRSQKLGIKEWTKIKRRTYKQALYKIKYPNFFEDRHLMLDQKKENDPWFNWSCWFGPNFLDRCLQEIELSQMDNSFIDCKRIDV